MTRADLGRLLLVGLITVVAFHASRSGRLSGIDHPVDHALLRLQPGYANRAPVTLVTVEADAADVWDRLLDTLEQMAANPPRLVVLMPVPVPPDADERARLGALREQWGNGFYDPLALVLDPASGRAAVLAPWGVNKDDHGALDRATPNGVVSVEVDDDGIVRRQQLLFGRAGDESSQTLQHVAVRTASGPPLVPDRVLLRPVPGIVRELTADHLDEVLGTVDRVVIEARVPRLEPLRYRVAGWSRPVSAGVVTAIAMANVAGTNWREPIPAAAYLAALAVIGALLFIAMRRGSLRRALVFAVVVLGLWVPAAWALQMGLGWRVLPMPTLALVLGLALAEIHHRYSRVARLTAAVEHPLLAVRATATAEAAVVSATGASAFSNVPTNVRSELPESVAFSNLADVVRDLVPVPCRVDVLEYLPVTRRNPDLAGWFGDGWRDGSEITRDVPALPEDLELDDIAVSRLISGEAVLAQKLAGDGTSTMLAPARALAGDATVLVGVLAITLRGDAEGLIREIAPFVPSVAAEAARAIREAVGTRALRQLDRPGTFAVDRLDLLAPVADADLDLTREIRAALDVLPVGIAVLDLSTRIRYANRAFALLPARRAIPLELQPPLAEILARYSPESDRTARDERVELAEAAASGIRARYPLEIDGRRMLLTVRALHPGSATGRSEPVAIYDTPQPTAPRVPGLIAVLQDAAAESRWARTRAMLAEKLDDARAAAESGAARELLDELARQFGLGRRVLPMPDTPDHSPFDLAEVCVEAAAGSGSEVTASNEVTASAAGDRDALRKALDGLFAAMGLKGQVKVRPGTDDRGDPTVMLQIHPGASSSTAALRMELSVLVDEHQSAIERLGGRLQMVDGNGQPAGPNGQPADAACCRLTFPAF